MNTNSSQMCDNRLEINTSDTKAFSLVFTYMHLEIKTFFACVPSFTFEDYSICNFLLRRERFSGKRSFLLN